MKKICDTPEVYVIPVPLPDNPLRELNSYLIRSGDESMLIDTGFRHPLSIKALKTALSELAVDPASMRIFLTHAHTDHFGSICEISNKDTIIYMSETDYHIYRECMTPGKWGASDYFYMEEGFPEEGLLQIVNTNPARKYIPDKVFKASYITDGMAINLGNIECVCVKTNGHSPGHFCLYLPEYEMMFLGDHVLFDITPNIACWMEVEDSLGDYLKNLDKIQEYPIKICLPGHRTASKDIKKRVAELKAHHAARIEATRRIVQEHPGLNAYQIASRLTWSMRGRTWEEFPMEQKWFAVGETIAHLDYLRLRSILDRESGPDGCGYYLD